MKVAAAAPSEWTQALLDERLRHWQAKLRLQDWSVTITIRRFWEMDDAQACVNTVFQKKSALISLREPRDLEPEEFSLDTLDTLIVHELLHLHIEPFEPKEKDGLEWKLMEQAINALAGVITGEPHFDTIRRHEVSDGPRTSSQEAEKVAYR
jgi:hypothetical protein